MRRMGAASAALAALVLSGCAGTIPADPDGTLDRVENGILRVGASPNGEWVTLSPSGQPQGRDVQLISDFAARLGARVEWSTGTEHILAERVEEGELDVMIGGLRKDTPWEKNTGLTRPYAESLDTQGKKHQHVMLVPKGENAFLLKLDTFLKDARGAR
ncbi:transporter substrate-binding domain-containing protein [Paenarthrobacter sp. NyZ202]|uniref:transporter substrate-binding domain-containing protein n=1 Tax=Paenarthrobacter sp. NyZ202 TaxID=3402689 RepID=UPI003CF454D8